MRNRKCRWIYYKLLDLLNEYPEFFNENEEGCPAEIVTEIRKLGKQLYGKDGFDMALQEYNQLKARGKTDAEIAASKKVSRQTLRVWKRSVGVPITRGGDGGVATNARLKTRAG